MGDEKAPVAQARPERCAETCYLQACTARHASSCPTLCRAAHWGHAYQTATTGEGKHSTGWQHWGVRQQGAEPHGSCWSGSLGPPHHHRTRGPHTWIQPPRADTVGAAFAGTLRPV